MATLEFANSQQTDDYGERFDEVFDQLELIAKVKEDEKAGNPKIVREDVGTRFSPERMVGTTALRFMIFSSDTRYQPDTPPLYSPSVTLFISSDHEQLHVKRRYLTADPSNLLAAEKRAEFEKIERYFKRYMGDSGSEIE